MILNLLSSMYSIDSCSHDVRTANQLKHVFPLLGYLLGDLTHNAFLTMSGGVTASSRFIDKKEESDLQDILGPYVDLL